MIFKILIVSAVILLVNRMLKGGPVKPPGSQTRRTPHDRARKSIEGDRVSGHYSSDGRVLRVQCPWCESWNVSQFRDLRSAYWFLVLLTMGLILLFRPEFPRVNVCNDCGKRWSFGERRQ